MKNATLLTSVAIAIISSSHALDQNPVESLIRKRLKTTNNLILPDEKDDLFLENFFGRMVQAQMSLSYSYSFSFSYSFSLPTTSPSSLPSLPPSLPPTLERSMEETEVPSISPTILPSNSTLPPSLLPTLNTPPFTNVPTPFSDSSNDDSESPSVSPVAPSNTLSTQPTDTLVLSTNTPSATPTITSSSRPAVSPTFSSSINDTTTISEGENEVIVNESDNINDGNDSAISSGGRGPTSMIIIPAIGVVTGVVIVGFAVKAIDRRNFNLQYRSLDGDSLSSFSLQA